MTAVTDLQKGVAGGKRKAVCPQDALVPQISCGNKEILLLTILKYWFDFKAKNAVEHYRTVEYVSYSLTHLQ